MKTERVKKIVIKSPFLKQVVSDPYTQAVLVIGSLAKGTYIEHWSDVDLLVIANNFNLNYSRILSDYRFYLEEKTKVKSGIELVFSQTISSRFITRMSAIDAFKLAKVFYSGSKEEKLVLYLKKGFRLPSWSLTQILKISSASHAIGTLNYISNLLIKSSHQNDFPFSCFILRKIIKNSIFLMQMYLLAKERKFISNFEETINAYKISSNVNIQPLIETFGQRFNWGKIKKRGVSNQVIQQNVNALIKIANKNIKIC